MSPPRVLSVAVGLIGPGQVGAALLTQLAQLVQLRGPALRADIRVVGIANSRLMCVQPDGLDLSNWRDHLKLQGRPVNLAAFAAEVASASPCSVLVDCSDKDAAPQLYRSWLELPGIQGIVTPNKKFGSGPLERFLGVRKLCDDTGKHFAYEATVGAGLPIISTLRSLLDSGDKVLRIEGILSGTLSYIFNAYRPGMRFSDVVADAKAQGYTEPDPRDDLSGTDVARKVVILARDCGLSLELESLHVESLVPQALRGDCSVADFMTALPQYDEEMAVVARESEAAGKVIRYVGLVDVEHGTASVSMTGYPAAHPFAQLSGSDNIIAFTTERYKDRPLIVRGPGAGPAVTASGLFGDIIHIIRCQGPGQPDRT